MSAVGGSIESISLDGRIFSVPADVESQRKLGGFENEVQANGDGTARIIKTRVPLSIDGLTVSIDDTNGDHEFINGLTSRSDFFPIVIQYASGVRYQALAQVVGENAASSQNSVATVSLMGPGELTRQ